MWDFNSSIIKYTIVRSSRRRRTTSITLNKKGKVTVRAPLRLKESAIKEFVNKKSTWIKKKQKELRLNPPPKKKKFINGEMFLYLGHDYPLKVVAVNKSKKTSLELKNGYFILRTPRGITKTEKTRQAREAFKTWYKTVGRAEIETRVSRHEKKLSTAVNAIRLKEVSSIWGSCSPKKNLTFNYKLIMAPKEIINYIVVHEVCHLKTRGHGKEFWELVESLDPDYKSHKKWLKDHQRRLTI